MKFKLTNSQDVVLIEKADGSIIDLTNLRGGVVEGYYVNGNFYDMIIEHDYVEINGVKWATMNLGANSITDYGLYFQWGDTQGYTLEQCGSGEGQRFFDWSNYKYCDGTDQVITKYNSTDNKTVLDAEDDAATAMWGSGWRMPTTDEYVALGESTTYAYTSDYNNAGIVGLILTDNTDSSKKLFFPAAGSCCDDGPYYLEENGFYMSSSVALGNKNILGMSFLSLPSYEFQIRNNRSYAHSIRAIYDGSTPAVIIPVTDAIYIDKTTNTQYRWDGTAYVQLTKLTYTTIDDEVEDVDETIISQALRKTSQSLTSSEKAQVLTNLGISDLISGSLQKTAQVLSSAEKTLVLTNLGISSAKNITISTSEPTSSDGNNGDIWLVYETQ